MGGSELQDAWDVGRQLWLDVVLLLAQSDLNLVL
jgi:hypothetical protein